MRCVPNRFRKTAYHRLACWQFGTHHSHSRHHLGIQRHAPRLRLPTPRRKSTRLRRATRIKPPSAHPSSARSPSVRLPPSFLLPSSFFHLVFSPRANAPGTFDKEDPQELARAERVPSVGSRCVVRLTLLLPSLLIWFVRARNSQDARICPPCARQKDAREEGLNETRARRNVPRMRGAVCVCGPWAARPALP
ncbi:hypothetical protein FB451DRAFT_1259754, partial [Mycena latifolia]